MVILRSKRNKRKLAVLSLGRLCFVLVFLLCFTSPKALAQNNTPEFLKTISETTESLKQVLSETPPLQNIDDNLSAPQPLYEQESSVQGLPPLVGNAKDVENTESDKIEDLVLAVFAEQNRLSAGLFAFQKSGRYYLPIGELTDIIGFNVDINQQSGLVEGWSLSEKDKYRIDLSSRTVTYRNETASLPPGSYLTPEETQENDFYVLADVLEEIWPLQLNVDTSSLTLKIIADGDLPFELIEARKKRQELALQRAERREGEQQKDYPFVAYPYQLVGKPVIDFNVNAGFDAREGSPEYQVSLNGVQDLLYASADYSISFAENNSVFNQPDNFRLRFKRDNIHEGALPFGFESTQFGDVNLRSRDLVANNLRGRGFLFSTEKNNKGGQFDLITIDGVATFNWETELYINNELRDFGVVDERGEYRFEDVPVSFGNNNIRVVLYGPQGQVRERVENYFYQSNMVKPGENSFSGGIIDSQRDLIPIDKRDRPQPSGLAANLYAARGITRNLTLFSSASKLQDDDELSEIARQYVSAGAIGSLKNTIIQAEVYKEIGAGEAIDIRTLSDFKGFKINTKAAFLSDFESPSAESGPNALEQEFDFNIRKIFKTALGSLGLEFGTEFRERRNKSNFQNYTTRQSFGVKGTRITNQTRTNLVSGDHSSTIGNLISTTRMGGLRLRHSFNYSLFPDVEGNSTQLEMRYGKTKEYSTALRLGRNFNTQETVIGAQITKDFDKFLGSAEADWSSDEGVSFLLRASTSLGPYGKDGYYDLYSESLRNAGPVEAFVYHDKNYDGEFNSGDVPLPNAKMVLNRRITRGRTGQDGELVEINARTGNGITAVSLSEASIEDPYFIPSRQGYNVYPRPGVMHSLEFPMIETGAIDGTVRWNAGGKPIAGLVLQLMDADANILQSSKSATDGYFTFERVPPGSYTIRADPESGVTVPFKYVDITTDNLFQFGQDIAVNDLNPVNTDEFGAVVNNDGVMSVKNIVSLAKGFKEKQRAQKLLIQHSSNPQTPEKNTAEPAAQELLQQQSVRGLQTNEQTTKPIKIKQTSAFVTAVRLGEHPDKIRIVLDLSAPIKYTIDHDKENDVVFIDLPDVAWSAKSTWESQSSPFLSAYTIEKLSTSGVRMVLNAKKGSKIGASGLLKANGDKKDRLYIDIER